MSCSARRFAWAALPLLIGLAVAAPGRGQVLPSPLGVGQLPAEAAGALKLDDAAKAEAVAKQNANDAAPASDGTPKITATLNQRILVRPDGFGLDFVKRPSDADGVVIDRPELFAPVVGRPGTPERPFRQGPGGSIELRGVRLGTTKIRVFDPADPKARPYTVTVQVVPDIEYLNRLLRVRFPMANLIVSAAGDNFLFVDGHVDGPADVQAVEELLNKFFVGGVVSNIKVAGVQQVQLEVLIARVDRGELRRLGFNTLLNNKTVALGTQVGALIATPGVALPGAGARVFPQLGTGQPPLTAASTAFFGVADANSSLFGFVEALRQHNLAKILANPTLVTFSGRQADFLVGGEQPIPIAGTITAPTVGFKAFGTRLTFLPTVLGGGRIRVDVVPEVSTTNFANSITVGGLQVPQFVVQRLHATVELQSGQTLCLGGLLQTEQEAQSEKVPILGELPVVGALFRRVRHRTVETELLVLITPRLFNPLEGCQVPHVVPGQSTRSPSDAQFFTLGAIESAAAPGAAPDGPPARLGDDMLGAYRLLTCPSPVCQPGLGSNLLADTAAPVAPAPLVVPALAPVPAPAPARIPVPGVKENR